MHNIQPEMKVLLIQGVLYVMMPRSYSTKKMPSRPAGPYRTISHFNKSRECLNTGHSRFRFATAHARGLFGMTFFLAVIALLPSILFGHSDEIWFECLSLEQGLSQSRVTCILQDHKGFMWFGTQDGLNRYDGYEFTVYRHNPGDTTSLSNDYITTLYEDSRDRLWIGTHGGGLHRFNRHDETFSHYRHRPRDSRSLADDLVTAVTGDDSGRLWIGTNGAGLDLFDPDNRLFTHHRSDTLNERSLPTDRVFSLVTDRKSRLWLGMSDGWLSRYDDRNGSFYRYRLDDLCHDYRDAITALLEDKQGMFWIGTNGNGFYRLIPETGKLAPLWDNPSLLQDRYIQSIYETRKGDLWLATDLGLVKLNRRDRRIVEYRYDQDNPSSLSGEPVESLYEDWSGVLWVGTYGGGVSKVDPEKQKFKHYRYVADNPFGLTSNIVLSLHEDRSGTLWVGTWDSGLNRFDRESGQVEHILIDKNRTYSNTILSIYEDSAGSLWIGTYGEGLYRYDHQHRRFTQYPAEPSSPNRLSHGYVHAILEDSKGVFWVGTLGGGLNRFDRATGQCTVYRHRPDEPHSLSQNSVNIVYEDRQGILWVGTDGGLNRFDRDTERFIRYENLPDDPSTLSNNRVFAIYEDDHGQDRVLWIGTYGGGLNRFDPDKGTFRRFMTRDGLPNNAVYGILGDASGRLWISTNFGISRFDPANGTFKNYTANDGLICNEYNQNAYCQSRTGEMVFGSNKGFVAFHPDSIVSNPFTPPVVLTDFLIFNKSVPTGPSTPLHKHISETESIRLSYRDDVFSFEFACLDYRAPYKNRYAYRMEGFDRTWNYINTRRFARYTSLPHGKYVFRVKASNNDGVWNDEGIAINVTIVPPFWQTVWFKVFVVLVALGGVAIGFKFRVRSIQNQKKKLENQVAKRTRELHEINATKDKFFSIIAHDLKGALTVQLSGSRLLHDRIDGLDKKTIRTIAQELKTNTSQLFKLLENLLNWSRIQMGRLEHKPETLDMHNIVDECLHLLKANAEEKQIGLTSDVDRGTMVRADRNMIRSLVQNLVSNAIKFTDVDGNVSITARPDDGLMAFTVSDTGTGISQENMKKLFRLDSHFTTRGTHDEKGSGLGLILCKEFVEKNGGTIQVESPHGHGTSVTFTLPLNA
jgi:two-component system sensor histidine kinase ChiS